MKLEEIIKLLDKDRYTTRYNDKEKLQLAMIMQQLNETDVSKVVKFCLAWTAHNLKNVTEQLSPAGYELIFQKIRKTQPTEKVVY
ncbi:MAG: hypothetical protein KAU20_07860 [Nanoarchaeota archaeon]|nr:hypothetical protein [Nanoarchaeota archaeon]